MLDTVPTPVVDESLDDEKYFESLAKELVKIAQTGERARGKLDKTKEEAEKASENSLKGMIDLVSGINRPMEPENVETLAKAFGDGIAKGNPNTAKVRKSEMKTIIETRHHARTMVDLLEKYREAERKNDPKYSLNLRGKTLEALRAMRKDETIDPKGWLREFHNKRHQEVSETEKVRRLLDKLLDSPGFKGTTAAGRSFMDKRAILAIETLRDVVENGPRDLDDAEVKAVEAKLGGPVSEPDAEPDAEPDYETTFEEPSPHEETTLEEIQAIIADATETPEDDTSVDTSGLGDIDIDELING